MAKRRKRKSSLPRKTREEVTAEVVQQLDKVFVADFAIRLLICKQARRQKEYLKNFRLVQITLPEGWDELNYHPTPYKIQPVPTTPRLDRVIKREQLRADSLEWPEGNMPWFARKADWANNQNADETSPGWFSPLYKKKKTKD